MAWHGVDWWLNWPFPLMRGMHYGVLIAYLRYVPHLDASIMAVITIHAIFSGHLMNKWMEGWVFRRGESDLVCVCMYVDVDTAAAGRARKIPTINIHAIQLAWNNSILVFGSLTVMQREASRAGLLLEYIYVRNVQNFAPDAWMIAHFRNMASFGNNLVIIAPSGGGPMLHRNSRYLRVSCSMPNGKLPGRKPKIVHRKMFMKKRWKSVSQPHFCSIICNTQFWMWRQKMGY